jgi:hypothetical protein
MFQKIDNWFRETFDFDTDKKIKEIKEKYFKFDFLKDS